MVGIENQNKKKQSNLVKDLIKNVKASKVGGIGGKRSDMPS